MFYKKKSGHYAIPLTSAKQAINNIDRENNSAVALTVKNINGQWKQTIALDHWKNCICASSKRSQHQLKQAFHNGAEHSQAFNFIGIHLKQIDDFSITINQIDYINKIKVIKLMKSKWTTSSKEIKIVNSQKKKSHHWEEI